MYAYTCRKGRLGGPSLNILHCILGLKFKCSSRFSHIEEDLLLKFFNAPCNFIETPATWYLAIYFLHIQQIVTIYTVVGFTFFMSSHLSFDDKNKFTAPWGQEECYHCAERHTDGPNIYQVCKYPLLMNRMKIRYLLQMRLGLHGLLELATTSGT